MTLAAAVHQLAGAGLIVARVELLLLPTVAVGAPVFILASIAV